MKVLAVLSVLILVSGCNEPQELTGPWEMWVIVTAPASETGWSSNTDCLIGWAAVPGEMIRCDLMKGDTKVMEIFGWKSSASGTFVFNGDLSEAGTGSDYRVMIMDDQGFYGLSDPFSIR